MTSVNRASLCEICKKCLNCLPLGLANPLRWLILQYIYMYMCIYSIDLEPFLRAILLNFCYLSEKLTLLKSSIEITTVHPTIIPNARAGHIINLL